MHEERLCQSCFKKERERVVMLLLVVVTTIFSRVKSKTGSSEASFDKWLLGNIFSTSKWFLLSSHTLLVLLDKLYS